MEFRMNRAVITARNTPRKNSFGFLQKNKNDRYCKFVGQEKVFVKDTYSCSTIVQMKHGEAIRVRASGNYGHSSVFSGALLAPNDKL